MKRIALLLFGATCLTAGALAGAAATAGRRRPPPRPLGGSVGPGPAITVTVAPAADVPSSLTTSPPPKAAARPVDRTNRLIGMALAAAVLVAATALAGVAVVERRQSWANAAALTGGDPAAGRALIERHGCAACHSIPGVGGADALVGPPLDRIGSRTYLAGVLPNTPDNLIAWIRNPPAINPGTAMPNLGVSEPDARHMAGYLYTLR